MNDHFVCPACRMGHLDLRLTTYVRQYGQTLISVPGTPAWVCDVCHERHFDPSSVQRIEMLIGQAGPPPNRYRPTPKVKRPSEPPSPAVGVANKSHKVK
jgi:YgiT-type zinc finger domain-containing protein